jgi:hypothetical protein
MESDNESTKNNNDKKPTPEFIDSDAYKRSRASESEHLEKPEPELIGPPPQIVTHVKPARRSGKNRKFIIIVSVTIAFFGVFVISRLTGISIELSLLFGAIGALAGGLIASI